MDILGFVGDHVKQLVQGWTAHFETVRSVLMSAWNSVLRPVFEFIINVGLWPIRTAIGVLRDAWNTAWGVIKTTVSTVWGILSPIFRAVVNTGLAGIKGAIQDLRDVWNTAWGVVQSVVQAAWNFIQPIVNAIAGAVSAVAGGIGKIQGLIGGAGKIAGKVAGFLGLDQGGWVPGAPGAPMLAVVHGGEYILSRPMLAGTAAASDAAISSLAGGGSGGGTITPAWGGGGQVIENHTHVYIDSREIQHTVERQQLRVGAIRSCTY